MIAAIHGILEQGFPTRTLQSIYFDGVNDYAVIPHRAENDITGAFSVYLRIRTSDANNRVIAEKANNNTSINIQTVPAGLQLGTNLSSRISAIGVNNGQWHEILFTWNGAGLIAGYLDNASLPASTSATAPAASTQNWLFGSRSGSFPFPGDLEFRLYNKVLTRAQFDQLRQGANIVDGLVETFSNATLFNGASFQNI